MRKLLLLALLVLPARAQTNILLSDAETLRGWGRAELISDAKVGRQAVRFRLPATGGALGLPFDLQGLQFEFNRHMVLCFWYRFSGQGESSLMLKVVDPVLSAGWQATWAILPRTAADGQWHRAAVDLGSEFMQWGDKPDLAARNLQFRVEPTAGAALTFDVDDVVLVPRLYTLAVGTTRLQGEVGLVPLHLGNPQRQAVNLSLSGPGVNRTVPLPAGAKQSIEVSVALPAAEVAATAPLAKLRSSLTVEAVGNPATRQEVGVEFVKPLTLPARPRLLLAASELPALKDRIARLPWAKAIADGLLKSADGLLTDPVQLPDRGSQWWHWYACKKDGGRLQTKSPTEHVCPVCQTVYTGWPYDDVVIDRIHGRFSDAVRTLGLVYQLTGEARYAAKARQILLAYAERYRQYPLHDINGKERVGGGRVGPQTLDESTWLIPITQGADLVWETLSPADQQTLAEGLFRPAAETITQHRMGIHNIQCWKNSAVGLVGLLLGDEALVADAVASEHGFFEQMAKGVNRDGQWYEGAWGYHFYTLSACTPLVDAGRRCGLPLAQFERDGVGYRRLFDGPLDLAMPNLTLPAFNDSGLASARGNRLYENALAWYQDPRYAAVLPANRAGIEALLNGLETLPAAPASNRGSRVLAAAGYTVLEHGAAPDAAWACLKWGPHGGGHGHPDKLNVALYRRGQLLGLDPGTTAYGVPLQMEWYRATLAHNTLTVNELPQKPAEGKSLAFVSRPGVSAALASAGAIYEGVTYHRAIALIGEDLFVMLDLATAAADSTFDIAWHNGGQWLTAPAGEPVRLPARPGYQHLKDVVKVAGELPLIDVGGKLQVALAVTSPSGETWAGRGFMPREADRPTATIRRVQGREAIVGWAIQMAGQRPQVTVTRTATGATLTATVGGQTTRLLVDLTAPEPLRVE
ncbi:MAG: heparinase II/III family protein [Fimbriimonadaceae bacterium]|nr:heparinase II/III family protein [Fimbriimonadaceae bacterium]